MYFDLALTFFRVLENSRGILYSPRVFRMLSISFDPLQRVRVVPLKFRVKREVDFRRVPPVVLLAYLEVRVPPHHILKRK